MSRDAAVGVGRIPADGSLRGTQGVEGEPGGPVEAGRAVRRSDVPPQRMHFYAGEELLRVVRDPHCVSTFRFKHQGQVRAPVKYTIRVLSQEKVNLAS